MSEGLIAALRKAADWGEDEFDVLSPQDAAAAADRIEALEREQGWQPIETAPKDGGEGLVGCWVYADAKRRTRRWSSWQTIFDGGHLGCDGEWGDEPTHWRPLPPPPTGERG